MKEHYIGGIHHGRGLCSPISHCTLGAAYRNLAYVSIDYQEAFKKLASKMIVPSLAWLRARIHQLHVWHRLSAKSSLVLLSLTSIDKRTQTSSLTGSVC